MTQSEEYLRLPVATKMRPNNIKPFFYEFEGRIFEESALNRLNVSAVLEATQSSVLKVNKYAFPGWNVYLNKESVEYFPGDPYGQISVAIPVGTHQITVIYKETWFRSIFNIISMVVIIGLLAGCTYTSLKIRKELE